MIQFNKEEWKWWTDTMEYVRTVPGTVYENQLFQILKKNYESSTCDHFPIENEKETVSFLNHNAPNGKMGCFLKADPVTGGIYTIPSQRVELDEMLYIANQDYVYNRYLYMTEFADEELPQSITFARLKENQDLFGEVFRLDPESMELMVDLTVLHSHQIHSFQSFDLGEIAAYYLEGTALTQEQKGIFHFGAIKASQIVFAGETRFAFEIDQRMSPLLSKGACFSEATFLGPFESYNLTFAFDSVRDNLWDNYSSNKVDFRNVRFFDKVSFRDIRFMGDILDMEITFEDARLQNNMEFVNVDFGHAKANFFQMVVGDYVDYIAPKSENRINSPKKHMTLKKGMVRLVNIDIAGDSQIDFSDAEMDGVEIILENIQALPQTKLCLAPMRYYQDGKIGEAVCPRNYLLLRNCEIQQTLYIGNFTELSFRDSRNYSKIVSAQNWGEFPKDMGYRTASRGVYGTNISNPILLAVYNDHHTDGTENADNQLKYAKAKDFIMLKENFCSAGMYDEEDEAFILYMEFKPYINSTLHRKKKRQRKTPYKDPWTNVLYKCLYATGKYGISPGRVVTALMVMVLLFGMIYFGAAWVQGLDAFSTGGTIKGAWDSSDEAVRAGITVGPSYLKLLVSFLYSLEGVIPFVSQFEPISLFVSIVTAIENAIGSFLVGYFSVAVVRKTLR